MYPELFQATKDTTSEPSCKPSAMKQTKGCMYLCLKRESGSMPDVSWETVSVLPGDNTTPNFGECPSVARESTLSQILEANAPEKYYLSARACEGILRRAEKRGKALPPILKEAMLQMIEWETASTRGTTKLNDATESMESSQPCKQESEADRISSPCVSHSQETEADEDWML
jgi:hypothetical protein